MPDKIFIDRPPRIEPQLPSGQYTIFPTLRIRKKNVGQLLQQAFLPACDDHGLHAGLDFRQEQQ